MYTYLFLGKLQADYPDLDISAGSNRTQTIQALIQMGVLLMTLFSAIIGGALTGKIVFDSKRQFRLAVQPLHSS